MQHTHSYFLTNGDIFSFIEIVFFTIRKIFFDAKFTKVEMTISAFQTQIDSVYYHNKKPRMRGAFQ